MVRFSHAFGLGLALLAAACGRSPAPPAQSANTISPAEQLSRIVERYWDARPEHGAALAAQSLADERANEQSALQAALALPRDGLDSQSRLTYDIFVRRRQRAIDGYTYPAELMPIEPFESLPLELARDAAKAGEGQLASSRDYDRWLRRIDDGVRWMRQAIVNMREGVRRGYTVPRVLVERMLPLLAQLGEDSPTNVFYAASHTIPDTVPEADRKALAVRLPSVVRDELMPAYRDLHAFLKDEYLPKARTTVSLAALPLGAGWYAERLARAGASMTPEAVHAAAAAETERIRARLLALQNPGVQAVGSDPIVAAEELKAKVSASLPSVFAVLPKADFAIRAFNPRYDEATMIYQPAAPPSRPAAVLFVASGSTEGRVQAIEAADFLQAAVPGRHLQSALQQERSDLPRFRRFGSDPGFVEGWAMYAGSLGEELGAYLDEPARRTALLRQLRCAAGAVVDTGIHAKGWTRDQALDYLRAQTPMEDGEARTAVDRGIALPGDAVACALGELKIHALRSAAQQALGPRFDLREFHAKILEDGSMPLDILEAKMKTWMSAAR